MNIKEEETHHPVQYQQAFEGLQECIQPLIQNVRKENSDDRSTYCDTSAKQIELPNNSTSGEGGGTWEGIVRLSGMARGTRADTADLDHPTAK